MSLPHSFTKRAVLDLNSLGRSSLAVKEAKSENDFHYAWRSFVSNFSSCVDIFKGIGSFSDPLRRLASCKSSALSKDPVLNYLKFARNSELHAKMPSRNFGLTAERKDSFKIGIFAGGENIQGHVSYRGKHIEIVDNQAEIPFPQKMLNTVFTKGGDPVAVPTMPDGHLATPESVAEHGTDFLKRWYSEILETVDRDSA